MSDVEIEIGKIYFPSLPTNHPLRKYCEEMKFDMAGQDKCCQMVTDCLEDFLAGLGELRAEEDFVEVANARESSFRGAMLTEDGDSLLLATDDTEAPPSGQLVGPDGGPL